MTDINQAGLEAARLDLLSLRRNLHHARRAGPDRTTTIKMWNAAMAAV